MTTVLVYGGRDYKDKFTLFHGLDWYHEHFAFTQLVNGGARGADQLSSQWAEARGVRYHEEKARWDDLDVPGVVLRYHPGGKPYNAAAGSIRNQKMLDDWIIDIAVEFPGGDGTKDMRDKLLENGVRVFDGELYG